MYMKLTYLLYSLVLLMGSIISDTKTYQTFQETIKSNYSKYVVIETVSDVYGEYELVYGEVNDQKSVSFIYIPSSQINSQVKVQTNKQYKYTSEGDVIIGYDISIKKADEIVINILSDENYQLFRKIYQIEELNKIFENSMTGDGENNFPKDSKYSNPYVLFIIIVGSGLILIVIMSIIATIVLSKFIKNFNNKSIQEQKESIIYRNFINITDYEETNTKENDEILDPIDSTNIEDDLTEEKLYEMYKKGEISYHEYLSKSRRFDED